LEAGQPWLPASQNTLNAVQSSQITFNEANVSQNDSTECYNNDFHPQYPNGQYGQVVVQKDNNSMLQAPSHPQHGSSACSSSSLLNFQHLQTDLQNDSFPQVSFETEFDSVYNAVGRERFDDEPMQTASDYTFEHHNNQRQLMYAHNPCSQMTELQNMHLNSQVAFQSQYDEAVCITPGVDILQNAVKKSNIPQIQSSEHQNQPQSIDIPACGLNSWPQNAQVNSHDSFSPQFRTGIPETYRNRAMQYDQRENSSEFQLHPGDQNQMMYQDDQSISIDHIWTLCSQSNSQPSATAIAQACYQEQPILMVQPANITIDPFNVPEMGTHESVIDDIWNVATMVENQNQEVEEIFIPQPHLNQHSPTNTVTMTYQNQNAGEAYFCERVRKTWSQLQFPPVPQSTACSESSAALPSSSSSTPAALSTACLASPAALPSESSSSIHPAAQSTECEASSAALPSTSSSSSPQAALTTACLTSSAVLPTASSSSYPPLALSTVCSTSAAAPAFSAPSTSASDGRETGNAARARRYREKKKEEAMALALELEGETAIHEEKILRLAQLKRKRNRVLELLAQLGAIPPRLKFDN